MCILVAPPSMSGQARVACNAVTRELLFCPRAIGEGWVGCHGRSAVSEGQLQVLPPRSRPGCDQCIRYASFTGMVSVMQFLRLFSSAANGLGMVCVEKLEIDTAKEIFAKVMQRPLPS